MSYSGRRIEQVMRRIAQQQNSPPGERFGLTNPIAGGLGRISNLSTMNSSQQNQQGFGQMLASLQLLRQMPNLTSGGLSSTMEQLQSGALSDDIPEPSIPEFGPESDPVTDNPEIDNPVTDNSSD